MNRNDFTGKLDTAIDGLAEAIAKKGVEYPEEFKEIPGASRVGIPQAGSINNDAKPYQPAMRTFVVEEATKLFAPWRELPDPTSFDATLGQVATGRGKIATKDVTSVGDIAQMDLGTQMPEYMSSVRTKLGGWRGKTIEAVHTNYVNHFDEMLFLQANTLRVLEVTLQAHQQGVVKAQEDTLTLVGNATAAVDAIDCWGGDANKNVVFNVVAGVAGVLGAAIPGVNAVVALAAAGAGLGLAKDMIESKTPESRSLGAGRISGVWSNMVGALDRHKELYKEGETLLSTVLNNYDTALHGQIRTGQGPDGESLSSSGVNLMRLTGTVDTGDVQVPVG